MLSSKQNVTKYFKKNAQRNGENSEEIVTDNDFLNPENNSVSLWKGKKTSRDYCGKSITKETVKIYYFIMVLFEDWFQKVIHLKIYGINPQEIA